jgi:hypothetical protein
MSPLEIKIGSQVFDRTLQRAGVVIAIHKHSNPNLDLDLMIVKVAPGALVWSRIMDLEQA